MTRVEPPQAQEEIINKTEISTDDISRKQGKLILLDYSVGTGMYINYFVSMRYLEDNVFNRIFSVVDDKGCSEDRVLVTLKKVKKLLS